MSIGLILLLIALAGVFLIDKVKLTKRKRNAFAITSVMLFVALLIKDIMLALLFTSIAYIVISKIELETFDAKKVVEKKKSPKAKVPEDEQPVKQDSKSEKPKATDKEAALPDHCKDSDLDKEFLKEYNIDLSKLEGIQTNVFDKYNYNVFYNELGENALDVQGIHNHEVPGYEK